MITAYSLAFGGFLLLGGRAADLFHWAFWICTGFALTGAAISGLVLESRDVPKAAELPSAAV